MRTQPCATIDKIEGDRMGRKANAFGFGVINVRAVEH